MVKKGGLGKEYTMISKQIILICSSNSWGDCKPWALWKVHDYPQQSTLDQYAWLCPIMWEEDHLLLTRMICGNERCFFFCWCPQKWDQNQQQPAEAQAAVNIHSSSYLLRNPSAHLNRFTLEATNPKPAINTRAVTVWTLWVSPQPLIWGV